MPAYRTWRWSGEAISLVVTAIGAVAWLGWWVPGVAVLGGLTSMLPASALAVAVAGLLVLGLAFHERLRDAIRVGSSALIVIGLVTLLLNGTGLSPDWALPGQRMSSATSALLVLLGLTILSRGSSVALVQLSGVFGLLGMGLAFTFMTVGLLAAEAFARLLGPPQESPLPVLCLFLLFLSVLMVPPYGGLVSLFLGPQPGSAMLRLMLPPVVALPLLVGWMRLHVGARVTIEVATAFLVLTIVLVVVTALVMTARALNETDAERQRAAAGLAETKAELETSLDQRERDLALLEALYENAVVGLAHCDADGRIVRVNGTLAAWDGLPTDVHLGKTVRDVFPDSPDTVANAFAEVVRTRRAHHNLAVATRVPASQGRIRHWQVSFYPVSTQAGEFLGVGAVILDVTDQWLAESGLRLLADVGRHLMVARDVDASLAGVAADVVPVLGDWSLIHLLDAGDRVRRVAVAGLDPDAAAGLDLATPSAEEIRGLAESQASARWLPVRADSGEASLRALAALGAEGCLRLPLSQGDTVYGLMTLVAVRGRRLGSKKLAIAEDVTRRVGAVLEKVALFRGAQEAAEMRSEALTVVSHDLKNPLSAILMVVSMMRRWSADNDPEGHLKQAADALERSAARMTELIKGVLDLARVQSRRLELVRADLSLGNLMREAMGVLEPLIESKHLQVTMAVPEDLPVVHVDRNRILQVLANLLGNAVQYTPAGGRIDVRAWVSGSEMMVAVSDNGPGIAIAQQDRLFEPFSRGARSGVRGTGLGLSIAKSLVEAHGGHIWVDSASGRGTTFTFALPLATPGAVQAA